VVRVAQQLIEAVTSLLPPWMVAPVLGVLVLLSVPLWLNSVRNKQISGAVRRLVRAPDAVARAALLERIWSLAAERPSRVLVIVREAIRYDQRQLMNEAMDWLDARGEAVEDLRIIRGKMTAEPKPVGHPLEVAVTVERLVEEGMHEAARSRLNDALARYPNDADLMALSRRLNAVENPLD